MRAFFASAASSLSQSESATSCLSTYTRTRSQRLSKVTTTATVARYSVTPPSSSRTLPPTLLVPTESVGQLAVLEDENAP